MDNNRNNLERDGLRNLAIYVLESQVAAELWLDKPQIALGGKTPNECAKTDAGIKEVKVLLYRIENGIF